MNKRMYWGLAILIILLIGVFIVMLTRTADTENEIVYNPNVEPSKNNPPPAEPGYKWEWHHNHWDRVKEDTPLEQGNDTTLNTEEYGVTRQGTRYLKNPAWADRADAHAIPTGPPLEIDWSTWANLNTWFPVDWRDPRVWESYRNFWGFDRPHVNPDGTVPWRAVLDNWGTPLQNFRNVSLVVKYNKRIGFRPTPEQFTEHQALVARYKDAQALGDDLTAASLRSQIVVLEKSAQGELPDPTSYFSTGYGGDLDLENLSDDELRRINREREAIGIRNLYKRLGIEHLYEFYEKPRF